MTRYDIARMYGYNSVEEYDEAEKRKHEIFAEMLKKQKPYVEKEPVKLQPLKRGKWEEHHATYIKQLDAWFVQAKCSYCGRYSDKVDNYSQYLDLEYCSHCGADMRGEG